MPLSDYNAIESTILNEISQGDQQAPAQPAPVAGSTPPMIDDEYKLKYRARGQDVEEPWRVIKQRASMGYDYAQLVEGHKQRETALAQREAQIQEFAKQWQPYIDYANQNPQWAEHVRTSFSQLQQQQFGQMPQAASPVNGEIEGIKAFIEDMKKEREIARQAQEDAALAAHIDSVVKEYPDFDWKTTDPATGESLEFKVIKHGQTNGIGNFRAAFRDLMHDKLIERERLRAKESVAQNIQQRSRQGYIGETSTPQLGSLPANAKPRNYDEAILRGLQGLQN